MADKLELRISKPGTMNLEHLQSPGFDDTTRATAAHVFAISP